jgi:hypothetical protein
VPVPPVPSRLPKPAVRIWRAQTPIYRVFDHGYGAAQYNAGGVPRRFRPVYDEGEIVPTLYGSDVHDGALCETVFHDLDLQDPAPSILRVALLTQILAPVTPAKDLRLAALTDPEIKRLRVTHGQLIDANADEYPVTAAWGQAIYDHPARFDGIVWNSRQHGATLSVMLWSSRAGAVEVGASAAPEPLFVGPGYDRVVALANAMDVVVVD